uniref:Cytokine receptor-like factor 3 n=1 Tax=Anthurium amnicola TaxID=1678845 RepID=A0A1D1Y412_9ARAE
MSTVIRACFMSFGSLLKKQGKIEKPPSENLRNLIPEDFEEFTPSSSFNENNRGSSIINVSKKKGALPPVVSEVTTLLSEADTSNDFEKSVELLEKATTLGSACAAAKLGLVYHGGSTDAGVNPDYPSAAAYYLLALKLIYMIPNDKWDMSLLLEVIAGLSEIFRKQMHRKRDGDIWMSGIRAMNHIEDTLRDPSSTKNLKQRELQKCKAIRIHINYCRGLTSEFDNEYSEATKYYEICKRIGECNFKTADKLVGKSQSKIKELKNKIPKVKPICVSCDYEPKELSDIWKLLVCSKCQVVAACSRECLTTHIATHAKKS